MKYPGYCSAISGYFTGQTSGPRGPFRGRTPIYPHCGVNRLGVRVASTGVRRWYSSPAGAAPGSQIGLREGNIIIRSCLQVVNSR